MRSKSLNTCRVQGFTLIELLVVVGIMVLVVSLGSLALAPMLRGGSLRSAAGTVQALIYRARTYAVTHSTETMISFDAAKGRMDLYAGDVEEDSMRTDKPAFLPTGIGFRLYDDKVVTDAAKIPEGKSNSLVFSRTGSLKVDDDPGNRRIRLTDASGERVKVVEVKFASGLASTYDE